MTFIKITKIPGKAIKATSGMRMNYRKVATTKNPKIVQAKKGKVIGDCGCGGKPKLQVGGPFKAPKVPTIKGFDPVQAAPPITKPIVNGRPGNIPGKPIPFQIPKRDPFKTARLKGALNGTVAKIIKARKDRERANQNSRPSSFDSGTPAFGTLKIGGILKKLK